MSIKRPCSLAELVTDRLRRAVVDGDLPFGMPLSEDALALAFGVSRTPVRDAFNQLQREGLVVVAPQRGSLVFVPDEDDIVEVCEYRLMLETRAAGLSMLRDPTGLWAALETEIREMEAAFDAGNERQYVLADWRYHAAFFSPCGNRYLREAYALASAKVASLSTNVTRPFPDQRTVSLNEHRVMLAHLRDLRMDAFEQVLTGHIGRTRGVYLRALGHDGWAVPSNAALPPLRLGC